jgi:hypothetical protein
MAKEFWYQISVKKGQSYLLCEEKDIKAALELLEIRPFSGKAKPFKSYTFRTEEEITKEKKGELLDLLKPCGEFVLKEVFR